ncbi:MAG: GGDEF domain-containing protein, partial [Myxococcota bacterium]
RSLRRETRIPPRRVGLRAGPSMPAGTAKAIGAEGVLEVPFEVARVQAKVRSTLQKARERRLERKRAVSMEQLRAALDSESGAGTRAQLLLSLDYEHTRALRYGTSLGCLVIDVDRLPAQVARPIALAGVVEAAKSALEGLDLIFRAADLRFVVLLPAIDLAGVERARAAVRTAVLDAVPGVALSFAGASMPEHAAEGGPALLAAALGNRFV